MVHNDLTGDHFPEEIPRKEGTKRIQEGLRASRLNTPHVRTENLVHNDLTGDHFPEEIPRKEGTKRIQEGLRASRLNTPHVRTENLVHNDLTGDHFPEEIPRKEGTKRKPSRSCFACNGSWSDIKNKILPKHCSRIWCANCKKVLCTTPCFKIFHTNQHYKNSLLNLRFPAQVDN